MRRELKTRISNAQVRAAVAVNKGLVLIYYQIGRDNKLSNRLLDKFLCRWRHLALPKFIFRAT
ncbi:hypothetical protein ICL16_32355 [Iningainema sp. BLCCT55]|uniref:Uncharacterized protein n=1 Tax=Iningainema tapete BLCC-T55 TaxID=2748662 RepID=A0A8J6XII7_9CYAN|nr:hypothetical protein [Iningainema tapete BLCC-T55]